MYVIRNYITSADLRPFLDDAQVIEAMSIFDVDKNDQVNLVLCAMTSVAHSWLKGGRRKGKAEGSER